MVNLVATAGDGSEVRRDFPHAIRVIDNLRIPLSDGVALSAKVWLPVDAEARPVPAVIEYAPFRHRDVTAPRDALIHPWFAGHGYASIRLELRGSGESSGLPQDEYVAGEQDDALEALAWISAQPWCSGETGLFGMSWGAFSALQAAARRPPSLKAIIAVHGTDRRFSDDVHFMGGSMLYNNLSWGAQYFAYMARPPDPAQFGPGWREAWLARVDAAPFVLDDWIGHQSSDAYWKHASVSEAYDAIACPVYVIGGWADGYCAAAMRMAAHLPDPKRVVIGPWGHTYPHIVRPGPRIGFLQDATRWWDRWLKRRDNGIDREPRLQLWVRDGALPAPEYETRSGRWVAFDHWPHPSVAMDSLFLSDRGLGKTPGEPSFASIRSPITASATGGEWLPHGVGPEMPLDQRLEDAGALTFDTAPLAAPLEICGAVRAALALTVDAPTAQLYLRLSDVAPGGAVTRVTHGLLNLAHRNGLDRPEPLAVGAPMTVELRLVDVAQRFAAGHRIRLSIGTQAWPLAWPLPEAATVMLDLAACRLDLPILPPGTATADPGFAAPATPPPLAMTWLRPVHRARRVSRDVVSGLVTRVYEKDDGRYRIDEHGMEVDATARQDYWAEDNDPLSAGGKVSFRLLHARGNWSAGVTCEVTMTADKDQFHLKGALRATEGDATARTRPITRSIKRVWS